MPTPPEVWIVDDDANVRLLFSLALGTAYRVTEFDNGRDVLDRLKVGPPALVMLDVQMPQLDGWETLRQLRERGFRRPVLMITTANDVDSCVRGLEGGADDYLGKPCSPAELLARVRALLRRVPRAEITAPPLILGDITIDLENRVATKAGVPLRLTRTDFAVLTLLREHAGAVVSRELILQKAWKDQTGNSHSLDTHIWRLRKKLGDDSRHPRWIKSVPAMGYILAL